MLTYDDIYKCIIENCVFSPSVFIHKTYDISTIDDLELGSNMYVPCCKFYGFKNVTIVEVCYKTSS